MPTRLAFGILLVVGLADLAWLDLSLAPQLTQGPPADTSARVADRGTANVPTVAVTTGTTRTDVTVVTPSATASIVTPPATVSVVTPSATASIVTPPATASTASPPATASVARPPPAASGEAMPDILFGLDRAWISSATALDDLRALADRIARDPTKRLLVRGHADALGASLHKEILSRRRAETVQAVLVARGVPVERVSIEAVSDREPADPAQTPEAWARNRRVQVLWR
jgi:peptidoglycan-associated lipoprotein